MKKITAIILVMLCLLSVLFGCNKMKNNTDTTTAATTHSNQNNGTVTDHDGVIGNEGNETIETTPTITVSEKADDNNGNTDGNEHNTTALIDNVL